MHYSINPNLLFILSSSSHLVLVALESLHDHERHLHLPLQAAVVPVEAVHGAGHVHHQPQQLRLGLGGPHLGLLLATLAVDVLLARQAWGGKEEWENVVNS